MLARFPNLWAARGWPALLASITAPSLVPPPRRRCMALVDGVFQFGGACLRCVSHPRGDRDVRAHEEQSNPEVQDEVPHAELGDVRGISSTTWRHHDLVRLRSGPLHLVIDSTGLKIVGGGKWNADKTASRGRDDSGASRTSGSSGEWDVQVQTDHRRPASGSVAVRAEKGGDGRYEHPQSDDGARDSGVIGYPELMSRGATGPRGAFDLRFDGLGRAVQQRRVDLSCRRSSTQNPTRQEDGGHRCGRSPPRRTIQSRLTRIRTDLYGRSALAALL